VERARIAAVVLGLISMAGGVPATAVHDPACGGTWTVRNSCPFEMQGIPVTASAEADAASGTVRVRVWISVLTPLGEHVLAECEDEGVRYATCDAEFGIGETLDPFLRSLPLICNVEGRGGGTYGCYTYPYL
jgi:hypothetical protein